MSYGVSVEANNSISANYDYGENLVSVIMALHDGVRFEYFVKAFDSIVKQSIAISEFIIVVDGNLSSQKNDYLASQQTLHTYVKVIRIEGGSGAAIARNVGLNYASGKYFAIMDSDDIALPTRLEDEVKFLSTNNDIAVVGSACEVIDEDDQVTGQRYLPAMSDKLMRYTAFFCPLINPSVMGLTDVIRDFGYEEGFRSGEDYRLWIRLQKAGYKIANIQKPLLQFRIDTHLYTRRVGYHVAKTDLFNRIFALKLAPTYLRPFAFAFSFLMFFVRLSPPQVVRLLTSQFHHLKHFFVKTSL